jgi:ParB-like chromosome segregation protein Spo0J
LAVDPANIKVRADRFRKLRPQVVDDLAESIADRGLLQPIIVRPVEGGSFALVAGAHRLEAIKKLGRDSVRAVVLNGLDADAARLAEIDENLIRADLSPAERALHLHERKRLYEKLHPETKWGGNQGASGRFQPSRQNGDTADRFTKDAADKTGKSERTLQREAMRAAKIPNLAEVVGTSLDSGDELDALAKLPEPTQRDLITRAKRGEESRGDEGEALPTRTGPRGRHQGRVGVARQEALRRDLCRSAVAL